MSYSSYLLWVEYKKLKFFAGMSNSNTTDHTANSNCHQWQHKYTKTISQIHMPTNWTKSLCRSQLTQECSRSSTFKLLTSQTLMVSYWGGTLLRLLMVMQQLTTLTYGYHGKNSLIKSELTKKLGWISWSLNIITQMKCCFFRDRVG